MKSLKLFNTVLEQYNNENKPFISEDGYIIPSGALYLKDEIISFYNSEKLNGDKLNKTFHKSWEKVKTSPEFILRIEQIHHYITTYGSDFTEEMYIPEEVLKIPNLKLKYKVIQAISKKEMTNKCLNLLESGIALKQESIEDVLELLINELNYKFIDSESIRNKEAKIILADKYSILPTEPQELLRFVVYKSTGNSLLIKNDETISLIKNSRYNPNDIFHQFGLTELSSIFNRFKPLFLAYKGKCPTTINKLSKLSKIHHTPLISNPLNRITSDVIKKEDFHWLENATPFALFSALNSCHSRMSGQDTFIYKIRNGKSFVKENKVNKSVVYENFHTILYFLKTKFDFSGKRVYLPKGVDYALPTSEKNFVGNIPMGTRFSSKKLAIGVYWVNDWGARDLDLSFIDVGGKVGWDSDFRRISEIYFSGDITNAPDGAMEYIYIDKGMEQPGIIFNNVWSGDNKSGFKLVVGKGSNIDKPFLMNPNKVWLDVKTETVSKSNIIGFVIPDKEHKDFILLNLGFGNSVTSTDGYINEKLIKALYQEWTNKVMLQDMLETFGAKIVKSKDECNLDLSLENLDKETFIDLFRYIKEK